MLRISDLNKTKQDTDSGREIEARALENAATMLSYCQDNWDAKNIRELLFEALRHNQTLWSILKKDLESPDNPLTQDIKNNLLALADFINKRTFEIQSWPSKEKLKILIDINKNIAAGLRGSPSD
jgi:flagellar protein FlaF